MPARGTADDVEARHAAAVRRRARKAAEAEEARRLSRRLYMWWQDIDINTGGLGAPALSAAVSGVVLLVAGEPLLTTLVAIAVGIVVGFLAFAFCFALGLAVADSFSSWLLVFFFSVVIPVVMAAAGTLVFAAFVW